MSCESFTNTSAIGLMFLGALITLVIFLALDNLLPGSGDDDDKGVAA